jgi:RHS repeat-associated protein
VNWILFDDQFKMVSSSSGAQQVGADNTFTTMIQNGLSAAKNGYLYVYVSNETPNINVYFDNLQVTHIKGPLLQEQSYYPFGLQMAGISDKALNKLDSKNKFNGGVELEEDYGVNLYSTFYRQYDPQIGRFGGVDVLSEKTIGLSTYQFAVNNPISYNDPTGAKFKDQNGTVWHHADPFADIPGLAGTPYVDGWGDDGFGGSGGGGGGGAGGRGRDYSAFWKPILDAASKGETDNIPGLTSTGTTRYYDYSNLSGSGMFETPNNDGVYTEQVGEIYHFIGATDATSYEVSYSGNRKIEFQMAGIGFGEFADHSSQMMNAGAVVYGGSEMATGGLLKYSSQIGETFGVSSIEASTAITRFGKTVGVWGKNLGTAGVLLTGYNIGAKLSRGEHVSTAEATNFGVSTVLMVGTYVAAGTIAAPVVAAASLIYGIGELGSYLFKGNTLEENIFGK